MFACEEELTACTAIDGIDGCDGGGQSIVRVYVYVCACVHVCMCVCVREQMGQARGGKQANRQT